MGIKSIFSKNFMMKVFILLSIFSCIAICQAKQNQFDLCLKKVKSTVHEVNESAARGLQKNWIYLAQSILEAGAEGIGAYYDCKVLSMDDFSEWQIDNLTER